MYFAIANLGVPKKGDTDTTARRWKADNCQTRLFLLVDWHAGLLSSYLQVRQIVLLFLPVTTFSSCLY